VATSWSSVAAHVEHREAKLGLQMEPMEGVGSHGHFIWDGVATRCGGGGEKAAACGGFEFIDFDGLTT
jgi:hypothetical protein